MESILWVKHGSHNHDLARLCRALWEHRREASSLYGRVRVPLDFPFSGGTQPTVAALIWLWESWPAVSSGCAECRGRVLPTGGGGAPGALILYSICVECGLQQGWPTRDADTRVELRAMVNSGGWLAAEDPRGYRAVLAILQELGAEGLPLQSAAGLDTGLEDRQRVSGTRSKAPAAPLPQPRAASSKAQPKREPGPGINWMLVAIWMAMVSIHALRRILP